MHEIVPHEVHRPRESSEVVYGAAQTLTYAHHRTSVCDPNVGCDLNIGAPSVGLTHSRHGHYHEGLAADDPAR